jgi:hypothetical protein
MLLPVSQGEQHKKQRRGKGQQPSLIVGQNVPFRSFGHFQ